MKHIVRKAYWDYEKEEKWINEMSKKGLNLVDYSWCRYTFIDSENEEYIYRLELLENWAGHPESREYINFIEESGVEHMASYRRWVYFRKKASDGPFEVYTDIESKIKYYKRVNTFWSTLAFAELAIGISNLTIAGVNSSHGLAVGLNTFNFYAGIILVFIGVFLGIISRPLRKKIRMLEKDAEVHQ